MENGASEIVLDMYHKESTSGAMLCSILTADSGPFISYNGMRNTISSILIYHSLFEAVGSSVNIW